MLVTKEMWFQYITCYSLSYTACPAFLSSLSFNTSHVTLYQKPISRQQVKRQVSIHHMLLFIGNRLFTPGGKSQVSIHHMLLFIPRFIGILSIHMSNNTPKPKEFQYFYQALLEILYF